MEWSELASVQGKSGLFRIIKPGKAGMLLESLDDAKTKMVAGGNNRLSLLDEISIYTRTKEGTVPLKGVMQKINKEFGNDPGVDGDSDGSELKAFVKSILPDYDEDRVYVSDMKKLVRWYAIILKHAPEVLKPEK